MTAKADFRFEQHLFKVRNEQIYNLPEGTYEAYISIQGREEAGKVILEYAPEGKGFLEANRGLSMWDRCHQLTVIDNK